MDQLLKWGDYLRIARRRIPYALVPFLLILVAAVSAVLLLPDVYRSTAVVAVESQQIPADLVRSTVPGSADERIGFVKQIVMTEARLEALVRKFGLYPEETAALPMVNVVEKLRDNVLVEAVRDSYASRATIAFKVSFDHTDPAVARDVATELVDLFLAENARTRNARATETAAFLRQETQRLNEAVRSLDQQVAEFKQRNSDALPEHLNLRVNMMQNAKFDLRAVQRDIAGAEQERRFLETQLDSLAARLPVAPGASTAELSPEERLQALRSDLARASALYTPIHPDIARIKRMIAQTEDELARAAKGKKSGDPVPARDPERAQVEAKIASIDNRLVSLRDQESELSGRIATLQSQILRTPEVEQGLSQISFDYQGVSKEYDQVRSKLQQAELAENLESQQMAERFILLEPPQLPVNPRRPDRMKLLILAVLLALGGGVGVGFVAEMLDNRIQDASMLTSLIGERPLAILPYIERRNERRMKVIGASSKWLALSAVLVIGAMGVRQYAEPLSQVLRRLYY
jgi:polysaccharide chain length determinant protein (PEP-CTERM system associated)